MIVVGNICGFVSATFNHIIIVSRLTVIQIHHCSIQRLTVKYMPAIDSIVVIPSSIGDLSEVSLRIRIVVTVMMNVTIQSILNSFLFNL